MLRGVSREVCELSELGLQLGLVLCQHLAVAFRQLELTLHLWQGEGRDGGREERGREMQGIVSARNRKKNSPIPRPGESGDETGMAVPKIYYWGIFIVKILWSLLNNLDNKRITHEN